MIEKTKVAIVILNWNGETFLKRFLPSVIKYSQLDEYEIVIGDNYSIDNSIAYLKKEHSGIRVVQLDKNYGFAEGYNRVLQQVDAEYYILLNSDIEITKKWIEPVIDTMEKDPKIAACAPKIKSQHRKEYFEYAGAAGGFIDKYGYPFCRGRIISELEKDEGQYDDARSIFWASGAAMFVRSSRFWEVGGFDADFFAHMEEIDLCWRFKNKGYSVVYQPDSEVFHVGGGTLPKDSPFKIYLNFRNNLFLLLKNLPKEKIFPIIFSRMILDGLAALIYLVSLRFRFFAAVWKAHISFYKNAKQIYRKRGEFKNIDSFTHSEIYKKSILIDFYAKKKKKFTNLKF